MRVTVTIDGSHSSGHYRCDCSCGSSWSGVAGLNVQRQFVPSLPVAEAVVHYRLEHSDVRLDVVFTDRFQRWLAQFWQTFNQVAIDAIINDQERAAARLAR